MKLVIIASPFAGDTKRNIAYGLACVKHSLLHNEAPIAGHLLLTQPGILNDQLVGDRLLGMRAGFAWLRVANILAVYIDHGISPGMKQEIELAQIHKVPVSYRKILS